VDDRQVMGRHRLQLREQRAFVTVLIRSEVRELQVQSGLIFHCIRLHS
jgi:hypothetical protein